MENNDELNITWNYTNKIVNDLIKINKAKEVVSLLEIPLYLEEEIKKETMIKRVHYSTKIEGNTLNVLEVKNAIENPKSSRERNALEVRNYYNALTYINNEAEKTNEIDIDLIFKIHSLVEGKKSKPSFRDGQNVVKNSETGTIIYLPPEAKDVSHFINSMINNYNNPTKYDIPIPIKAAILAYEFVTIHPFWDGNGRTSRLLATYILKSNDYDLKGFYVMEEFYDKNIEEYYNSLQMDLHHNFYFGRNNADITKWIEYFIEIMADTFSAVLNKVEEIYLLNKSENKMIDTLDKREKWILNYLINSETIKSKTIAEHFKVSKDTANNWIKKWLNDDFLTRANEKQIRNLDYKLSQKIKRKFF